MKQYTITKVMKGGIYSMFTPQLATTIIAAGSAVFATAAIVTATAAIWTFWVDISDKIREADAEIDKIAGEEGMWNGADINNVRSGEH